MSSFAGRDFLNGMGASWFVSYAYYDKLHQSGHVAWKNITTVNFRKRVYNSSRYYHEFWLEEVLKMNDKQLEKNEIGLPAAIIKHMAEEILLELSITPLMESILEEKNYEAKKKISKASIDEINKRNRLGYTALMLAVNMKNLDIVDYLLTVGNANPNITNNEGETALELAYKKKLFDICQILAKAGSQDHNGNTPLFFAVKENSPNLLHVLVHDLESLEEKDSNGDTLLIYAIKNHLMKSAEMLVELGANINIHDKDGDTPILLAIKEKDINFATKLLEKKASIYDKDSKNENALIVLLKTTFGDNFVKAKIKEFAEKLIDEKTINSLDEAGRTPLIIVSSRGFLDITKMLIEKKADTNIQDFYGNTALHKAIQQNHLKIVEVLLLAGANRNLKNKDGDTPSDIARKYDYKAIINLLEETI